MNRLLDRFRTRDLVIILLVCGVLYLAVHDITFRPTFGDIAQVGLGGYLGQLIPRGGKE